MVLERETSPNAAFLSLWHWVSLMTCTSKQGRDHKLWSFSRWLFPTSTNSIYYVWLHFLVNETANYVSLHFTQSFRAKGKIQFYIEKPAKTYAAILLQQGKESRCHYFLWGSETLKKFVRGNWITYTGQFYTWQRDAIQTKGIQKCT